jgi:Tfp pilus assembly protein PilF
MTDSPRNRSTGLTRAQADLVRGDTAAARHRLKSYLVDRSTCMDARRLLAHAYRVDGHADEAGRWGYLDEGAATDAERAAYEHRWPWPG